MAVLPHDSPLLFFVIVPSWSDAYFFKLLSSSRHLRVRKDLRAKRHEYIDGLQHRADRVVWEANVASTWFVLATDRATAGVTTDPTSFGAETVLRSFCDSARDSTRVFQCI